VILRLDSGELRRLADQIDALTMMEAAGADHLPSNTQIKLDGRPLAYAHWWEDGQQYLAEFINFTPGNADPLLYHDRQPSVDGKDA
jgi:hypothetical protein